MLPDRARVWGTRQALSDGAYRDGIFRAARLWSWPFLRFGWAHGRFARSYANDEEGNDDEEGNE